jgi:hypothetical protein
LVRVGFNMYSIILRSYSISTSMSARSSLYIKDNDRKYGVIVMFRDPKTSKVNGLQCRLCITFGWGERFDCKHKAMTKM